MKETLSKAKALFCEDFSENYEDAPLSIKLLHKHKIKDTDDASLDKHAICNQFKKSRFSEKFQILNELKGNDTYEDMFKIGTFENSEKQMQNIGFQTASGQTLNVTEEALSKAKALFCEDISKDFEDAPSFIELLQKCEVKDLNDASLDEHAMSNHFKKSRFSEKFQIVNELKGNDTYEDMLKIGTFEKSEKQMQNIGFQTAIGQTLNVTKETLSKAKALFCEDCSENYEDAPSSIKLLQKRKIKDIDDASLDKHAICNQFKKSRFSEKFQILNELNGNDTYEDMFKIGTFENSEKQMQNIGFQTASGQTLNVTEEALSKAKALFCEDISKDFEDAPSSIELLQKCEVKDLNDASLDKHAMSNQFKKLQFSSEFQESRNVHGCSENYKKERNEMSSVSNNDTNNLMNVISKTGMSKQNHDIDENSLISHEITESTIALLADENSLGTFHEWVSPVHNEENEDVTNIPSSPVIGGQFISRKRKCVGVRKKTINSVKHKQSKLMHNDCTTKLNDNHVWSDQYIKEGSQESTDKENKYISTISNDASVIKEFDDMQFMLDFINESATILERRLQAAFEQDRQIKLKEKCKPKPKICKLYFNRRTNHSNRISWKEITKGNAPIPCTYKELVERKLPPEILDITAGNAVTYRFRFSDFYGQNVVQSNVEGIKLEDDACVILDENGYAGISEIKRSFLASSGVDPNLLPTGWLENHYRWIVWKLGSMDRMKFASVVLPRVLTPTRVMMELKYRYDREIDRSQRSALRKILEKDDVATKRMVLCVSSIIECDNYVTLNTSPKHMKPLSTKLTLTDGWYSVQAVIDQAMIKNIISGKLKEGTKLITYGSELLNCDQGCSPLEVPENACLRIHTNSTRRARWYTKLGYIAPTGPMCVKLKSISSNGGLIGRINVMIARIYPILYHEKTCSGESIFRNTRCEEKAGIAYERECRSMIEAFHAKTEKYFSIGKRRSDSNPDSFDLAAMEWTEDCEKLSKEEFLSMQEQESLVNMCRMKEEKFRQKLESRLQRSLPSPRQVTPVLKIRVIEEETSAILSIWSPNEEVTDILKEGNCISVCNITPSMRRNSNLQLTAGRNALFERVNISNKTYPRRIYTSLCDVNKPTFAPAYGEFDTVGIVSSVGNEPYGMKNFQAVYLAYPYTDSQSSYLSILFWHGISSHGYTEILTVGSSVACSNLEWRRATSWNVPIAYCTERSNFSRNPKQSHLQQPFEELKRLVTDIETYVVKCAAEISEEMQKKSMTRSLNTPDKIFSNEKHNSELQESPRKNLMNSSAKSVAIQKRLKKLQCYGETSPLSPIVLNNSSKRISLNFQSPIRTSNVKQMKVHVSLNTKLS